MNPKVAGVVLAAGQATRMKGRLKQLLPCQGETLVHRATRTALEAKLSPVWVVVGAGAAQVRAAVSDLPVQCLPNPRWAEGQSTSVTTAARQLRASQVEAAIFFLADQPFVPPALVQRLILTWQTCHAPIIVPRIALQRSNPVLISSAIFPFLETLTGDQGARALFDEYPPMEIIWNDPLARAEIDTLEDYCQWCPDEAIGCSD